jgi:hypothetical protein
MSARLWVIDLTGNPYVFDDKTFVSAFRGYRASFLEEDIENPYKGNRAEKDAWYDLYLLREVAKRH